MSRSDPSQRGRNDATYLERERAAIQACTRALADTPDAIVALTAGEAATVGGLRAAGDRLALRQRFHDAPTHQQHQPGDPAAAVWFMALELARLDARGARWLRGIAQNLIAHPGAENDGPRWLAFEIFSGSAVPRSKVALATAARAALPSSLIAQLTDLAAAVGDQPRFAAAASQWARDAVPHLTSLPTAPQYAKRLDMPSAPSRLRRLPKRGDPGATSAPLLKRTETQQDGDGSASGNVGATSGDGDRYRIYTTSHDRVINALALATRDELVELHARLEAELTQIRSIVARLAKRLMRVLMARQTREWRFDLEEGLLDGSRLASLVASRGNARPFKQESESPFPSTVVSLLIDHSGSMRGRPMLIAALTVEIIARVLERCGIRCEVLGFTTREWDGGEPAREWAANRYPENPGRLNALEHIVIKAANVPWRRARLGLGLFLRDGMLKENIDGEAVAWAHGRLLTRTERRRILVVVSDGTPMDEATLAANGHDYLERHLQGVVEEVEARSTVQLAAIGIGHNVSAFYANATRIARIDQLGPALTAKLMNLLA